MDNKQFLTNEQINSILDIVMRDNVYKQVDDAFKVLTESEEYKTKLEEIKNSKDTLDRIERENTRYQNELKAFDLFQQIKAINEDFVKNTNWDEETTNISWLVGTTVERLEDTHKMYLDSIDNDCEHKTRTELKINSHWNVRDSIYNDLKARLLLTSPSDYNSIITDIVKYINIDKHLRS